MSTPTTKTNITGTGTGTPATLDPSALRHLIDSGDGPWLIDVRTAGEFEAGAGLTFAALSNTCAMGMLLAKLPYNRGPRSNPDAVIAALAGSRP